MTVRATFDRGTDAEEGIQQHVGIHDHGGRASRVEQLRNRIDIDREGPETDEQSISGSADTEQEVVLHFFFVCFCRHLLVI